MAIFFLVVGVFVFITGIVHLLDVPIKTATLKQFLTPLSFILIGLAFFFLGYSLGRF